MTALKDTPAVEPEILIEQARRRQRRRRAGILTTVLAIAAGAGIYAAGSGDKPPAGPIPAPASAKRAGYPSVNARALRGYGDLAFVSLGTLFVLDGATGRVAQVPPLTGSTSDPQFSPDHRWLAFQTGGNDVGVAAADGAAPHLLRAQSLAGWLPDGELLTTPTGSSTTNTPAPDSRYRMSSSGRPIRVGAASADLMAWSPSGHTYVFDVTNVGSKSGGVFHGTNSIETASSLSGRRTVWKTLPVSLGPKASAVAGDFAQWITVLPLGQGLLVWTDPGHVDDADGLPVYLIRSPGGPLRRLGITVGQSFSIGPRGQITIDAGSWRVAWQTKTVETCELETARCTAVATPRGGVSVDPSWSPDGSELAYVQARSLATDGSPQSTVASWYATRTLWVLPAGASTPRVVAGAQGAATPIWSADGKALMFVKRNALWLVHAPGTPGASKPVRLASPLFAPSWPSYYGQVDWTGQFAWSGESASGSAELATAN
jgi:WD40-like Beta Propeller Repeat